MNQITVFNFESYQVRSIEKDGEPWFVASDICEAIEHSNTSKAVADHVHDDDKANYSLGLPGSAPTVVNESGMYALIFGSHLEKAKEFKRWVTSEVLPSIRKTGSYSVKKNQNLLMLTESMAVAHERNMLTKQDASNILSAAALSLFPGADVILNSLISESEKKEVSSYEKSWIKFKKKRSVSIPSGHKNISWIKSREKWKAHVRENGQRVYIGLFLTIEEAVAAVEARKAKQAI